MSQNNKQGTRNRRNMKQLAEKKRKTKKKSNGEKNSFATHFLGLCCDNCKLIKCNNTMHSYKHGFLTCGESIVMQTHDSTTKTRKI